MELSLTNGKVMISGVDLFSRFHNIQKWYIRRICLLNYGAFNNCLCRQLFMFTSYRHFYLNGIMHSIRISNFHLIKKMIHWLLYSRCCYCLQIRWRVTTYNVGNITSNN